MHISLCISNILNCSCLHILRAELVDEDTDPGAFELLVNVVELQRVSHLSYRRPILYRQKNMNYTEANTHWADTQITVYFCDGGQTPNLNGGYSTESHWRGTEKPRCNGVNTTQSVVVTSVNFSCLFIHKSMSD